MLISTKPEELEARAAALEQNAEIDEGRGLKLSAKTNREKAKQLRAEAAKLRKSAARTDGGRRFF